MPPPGGIMRKNRRYGWGRQLLCKQCLLGMLIDDASHGAPSVNKAACRQETVVRVSNEPACLATRPPLL